ncbi:GtrA family protein [Woodsholea maritima]|uniref:GtrA family protein n=1 Tax=Woodsholea maritima TaxID=240237 RepID=UPI000382251D|nr:GtrA family protein [Woodsholea maritima]
MIGAHSGRILKFAFAGGLGFLCDSAITLSLTHFELVNPYLARALAFIAAVVLTWVLNRFVTFAGRRETVPLWRQFLRYVAAQIGGLTLNFVAYSLIVVIFGSTQFVIVMALMSGSALAMGINYLLAHFWVFKA